MTKAAGVKLGELLSISYNWAELDLYSDTNYGIEARCLCDAPNIAMDITPDNIEVGDSATFVWAIA